MMSQNDFNLYQNSWTQIPGYTERYAFICLYIILCYKIEVYKSDWGIFQCAQQAVGILFTLLVSKQITSSRMLGEVVQYATV